MTPEKEALFQHLLSRFEQWAPAEQTLMLRLLDKMMEKGRSMDAETFKAYCEEIVPRLLELPDLLRHLKS